MTEITGSAMDKLSSLPHFKAEVFRDEDGELRLRERNGVLSMGMIGAEAPFGDLDCNDDPVEVMVYIKVKK